MKAVTIFLGYLLGVWLGLLIFGHPSSLKHLHQHGYAGWKDQTNQPIKTYTKFRPTTRTVLLDNRQASSNTKTPKPLSDMLASVTTPMMMDVTKVSTTDLDQLNQRPTAPTDRVTTISTAHIVHSSSRARESNQHNNNITQPRSSLNDPAGPT